MIIGDSHEYRPSTSGFNVLEKAGLAKLDPKELWVVRSDIDNDWVPVSSDEVKVVDINISTQNQTRFTRYKTARSHAAIQELLCALSLAMSHRASALSFKQCSCVLYGLQGSSFAVKGVSTILDMLCNDLHLLKDNIKASDINNQSIARSFFGLQNMSNKSREVLELLRVLSIFVNHSENLNAQAIANSLYGLQEMSCTEKEVEEILDLFATKLKRPSSRFSGQNFGNALFGLKNMDSSSPSLRRLLKAIATEMASSSVSMTGQNIANSIYAMQGMNIEHEEVRMVLAALAHKLMTTPVSLTGLDVGMSLYGLRSMAAAEVPEVTVLLGLLVHKIKTSSKLQLEVGELSLAVIGV